MRYTRGRFGRIRQKDTRFIKMRFTFRDLNGKRCPFALLAFHVDRALMHKDKFPCQMQSDTRSRSIALSACKKALEYGG